MVTKKHIKTEIDATVKKLLTVVPDEINGDCLLGGDVGLDSIDIVELALHLEKRYHIEFNAAEEPDYLGNMTVNQLVDLVYSKYIEKQE